MVPGDPNPAQFDLFYRDPGVLRGGAGWYKGDLHCHTHHSEAQGTLGDVVGAARERGLDFLAITEHNTVSHLGELADHAAAGLLLIPGEEITTYYGHLNFWGITGWHEFRARTPAQIQQIIDAGRDAGAVVSINHPKEQGPPWQGGSVTNLNCIEAWQAYWFVNNYQSLHFWDECLRRGERITAVGGSDCHQEASGQDPGPVPVGTPTTWVYARELSVAGILDGIRAGHVFVTSSPDQGPHIYLSCQFDDRELLAGDTLLAPVGTGVRFVARVTGGEGMLLRLIAGAGELARVAIEGREFLHEQPLTIRSDDYLRAEVIASPEADLREEPGALWVEALSNPIFFRVS
jgi:hypothetical protein